MKGKGKLLYNSGGGDFIYIIIMSMFKREGGKDKTRCWEDIPRGEREGGRIFFTLYAETEAPHLCAYDFGVLDWLAVFCWMGTHPSMAVPFSRGGVRRSCLTCVDGRRNNFDLGSILSWEMTRRSPN
jgi:hypothetical protein